MILINANDAPKDEAGHHLDTVDDKAASQQANAAGDRIQGHRGPWSGTAAN